MDSMNSGSTTVKPAPARSSRRPARPRYASPAEWPAWTDEERWSPVDADYRPTAGPDFIPTAHDLADASAILNGVRAD